jgi:hypothetical protein
MTITAIVVKDSLNTHGDRLTTMHLHYPWFIHDEFMKYQMFSSNTSASQAIPVQRLIENVRNDTVWPSYWGPTHIEDCMEIWRYARDASIEYAKALDACGANSQIVSRLLEPFSHIDVLVSATEYDTFFQSPKFCPEIRELADKMYDAVTDSDPDQLGEGEWHLPFITIEDFRAGLREAQLAKVSAARCARVSYLTHEGKLPTIGEDIMLFDRMIDGEPVDARPQEHPAMAWSDDQDEPVFMPSNFSGFVQLRKVMGH